MQPVDRASFITYCLEMNGQGAVNVEVTPAQADNLVDDALQTFREYHYDATFRTYLSHQIQATDITNKWIPCDDSILTVVRALKVTQSTINLFDIRYQLKLQDFYNYSNVSMVHYEITQEKLALLDWMLNPEPTVAFERYMNQIHVNLDWEAEVNVGDWIVFEVYKIVDEIDFPRIWQDKWLKAYAVALFKRMQGTNLKKLGKINEVGGVVLNGQQIWDEANKEIERLEKSLREDYQPPARIFLG